MPVAFLGALAKFRKATISSVMSDRPTVRVTVRIEQTGRIFVKFYI
jgi:hypothetical protein